MQLDQETLKTIISSLQDYNPTAYELMGQVSTALIPVGLVILSVLMYIELAENNKRVAIEQGQVNMDMLISVTWKYVVAYALVMTSGYIIDSIIWLNGAIATIIDRVMVDNANLELVLPKIEGKLSFMEGMFINSMLGLATMTFWLAEIIVQVLIFLRFFQLYLYKAAAPVLVACYISEEWRSISTGYIKQFIALIIQGFLLVLILKLYPALMANDMFSIAAEGNFLKNLATCFLTLLKSGVLLFVLIGSQNMAKRWMGV
ncbi:hypothetical protein [Enterococcus sp. AZ012]|uniref:hypothetical protein n=1 Tax=unclassified Enterococcus TaxID=2608891 RepID=UPI003D2C318A